MSHHVSSRSPWLPVLVGAALATMLSAVPVLASTGGGDFPWDPLLDAIVTNIGGRTLRNILILAIIGAGIGFYFAAEGTWIRSAFGLVIGFSIAVAAATWGPSFFGVADAAPRHPGIPRPIVWTDGLTLALTLATWMAVVGVAWHQAQTLVHGWWGHRPPVLEGRD